MVNPGRFGLEFRFQAVRKSRGNDDVNAKLQTNLSLEFRFQAVRKITWERKDDVNAKLKFGVPPSGGQKSRGKRKDRVNAELQANLSLEFRLQAVRKLHAKR